MTHPDLQANLRLHFSQAFYDAACPGASLANVDEAASSPGCPNTDRGHGTHVAGLIAATPNNDTGVAGTCWDCSLIIGKAFQANAAPTSSIVNGIYHAIIRGASVINRSGGGFAYLGVYGVSQCGQLLHGTDGYCDAIALADMRHTTIVAATGNNDSTTAVHFPSSEPKVVGVGATFNFNDLWTGDFGGGFALPEGTNRSGTKPELVAGGHRVVSTIYASGFWGARCRDSLNNALGAPGVGYDECTGTSMSSPQVAGVIAMARSVNPLLSSTDVVNRVKSTARNTTSGFKMPDALAAVQNVSSTNSFLTPLFSMVTSGSQSSRYFTVFPQMATASIKGTMLPTLNASTTPVYYVPDYSAPTVSNYGEFPDNAGIFLPTAYFKVYTQHKVGGVTLQPLFRLSKLQNAGSGIDSCGYGMPVPSKQVPVLHVYTTSDAERLQLMTSAPNKCFKYDGVEGYVASSNITGTLQQLYRLYNPTADSYILVPSSKLTTATSLGYTQSQTALGWVVPN